MELEVDTNDISEESIFEIVGDIEATAFENERCGICMDVIIDRGVLDCCQHWFCFACIDNWASITNLCPLCQNEFQSITCVPVYDTIGSSKFEDDSLFRDDDWCIQGKNNTLSFPSYYIDENAVICLDGDGCKIRKGVATTEEGSNLDTSIACDSCDIWYHAFCVGFDPESTSENSWLCPRCIIDEVPQKSAGVLTQMQSNQCVQETASHECSVEAAISGKLSVSVADAGETAVVVSMIEGKQWIEEPSENILSVLEINNDGQDETFLSYSNASSPKMETQLSKKINTQPNVDAQETSLALSLSCDTHFILPCDSLPLSELKTICVDKAISQSNGSDGCKVSSELLSDKSNVESEPSENEPNINLHLGLSVGTSLSVDKMNSDVTENYIAGDSQPYNPSEESNLSVEKMVPDSNVDAAVFSGVKRKSMSSRDHVLVTECTELGNNEARAKMETEFPAKKTKLDENSQQTLLESEVRNSMSGGTQKCSALPAASNDDKLRDVLDKEADTSDIMSIVQGTDHRPSNGAPGSKTADKSSKERDGVGLRVKKIMRRAAEEESSKQVEKLRKEIRETVHNKDTKDFSKSNLFDPKLLAAFRAAIVGPRTEQEPVRRLNPSVTKGKKSILQKGKIRENLTKKIYGTASGKRRRAWDRDWEVEFWKYRCMRTPKPEKVETLKSVLDLLRRSSDSSEAEHELEGEATNPILSRLYLADTSVFPRKDDIKPLSALKSIGNKELNKDHNLKEKNSKPIKDSQAVQTPKQTTKNSSQIGVPSCDNKGNKGDVPSLKGEAACKKVHSSEPTTKQKSISSPCHSKMNAPSLKEMPGKSDVKSDKRKWALEVLARKTAMVERDATQGKQEDKTVLKGNFPLLAQLPTDMKPVLAASCHNKVPISVRQAQLYRLTEHFLRKANLPVIRRTADTELAVADAVNIEKEVADKSNSKLVYVNLCSQVLAQHTSNGRSSRTVESNLSHPSSGHTESTELASKEPASDPSGEEALRMAGLVSDSPPNSPYHLTKDLNDEDDPSKRARDEGPDNVFDMDTQPEMDIYGDFEYDLDNDYIGGGMLKVSNSLPEEGDSKMKVVFSTLNYKRKFDDMDSKEHEMLGIVEAPTDSPCVELHKDNDMEGSTLEVRTNTSCPPTEPLQGEICKEPSLAECEELYGPDKEPLVDRFPDKASREPDIFIGKEAAAGNTALGENGNYRLNISARESEFESESCAENIFVGDRSHDCHDSSGGENSPKHSLTSENVPRKEKQTKNRKQSDISRSISKKVEAYIKEHIRPLCKSRVITAEQYRWAVGKTTEKVMRYHFKDKNANFLIKEGEKVKKLAEQYVEAAQQKERQ